MRRIVAAGVPSGQLTRQLMAASMGIGDSICAARLVREIERFDRQCFPENPGRIEIGIERRRGSAVAMTVPLDPADLYTVFANRLECHMTTEAAKVFPGSTIGSIVAGLHREIIVTAIHEVRHRIQYRRPEVPWYQRLGDPLGEVLARQLVDLRVPQREFASEFDAYAVEFRAASLLKSNWDEDALVRLLLGQ